MQEANEKSANPEVSEQDVPPAETNQESEVEDLKGALKQKEDQLLRTLAEFDNYRKRISKEIDDIGKAGKRDLLLGILAISDSFERAFQSEALKSDLPTYAGIRSIYRQIQQLLEQHQVMSFESLGQRFDPKLHEAVGTEPSHKYPEGTIGKEIQKGYLWEGKVLRPAQVLVVKNQGGPSALNQMA